MLVARLVAEAMFGCQRHRNRCRSSIAARYDLHIATSFHFAYLAAQRGRRLDRARRFSTRVGAPPWAAAEREAQGDASKRRKSIEAFALTDSHAMLIPSSFSSADRGIAHDPNHPRHRPDVGRQRRGDRRNAGRQGRDDEGLRHRGGDRGGCREGEGGRHHRPGRRPRRRARVQDVRAA